MAIETLSATAIGYLLSSIKNSKGATQASDELTSSIWEFIRPIFLKDDEPIEDLKKDPESKLNQTIVSSKIQKFLEKNPNEIKNLEEILTKLKEEDVPFNGIKITQNHSGSGDNIGRDKIVKG